jgi:uncharacterized protein (TIGR02246 family)
VQDVRALVDGYAVAADERDADRFAALFADDAWMAVGDHRFEGRDAIATIPERLAKYDVTMHLVSTHRVDVDGDRATGVTYCEAHHRTGETDKVMFIRYDDEYARGAEGWRFASRTLRLLWEEMR